MSLLSDTKIFRAASNLMFGITRQRPVSKEHEVQLLIEEADRARDAKRWANAAELYSAVLDRCPHYAHIHIQCGHMYKEEGKYDCAEMHYIRARFLAPRDPDLHLQLGHFYKVTGRFYESFSAYARAAELLPDWSAAKDELDTLRELVRSRVEREGLSPDAADIDRSQTETSSCSKEVEAQGEDFGGVDIEARETQAGTVGIEASCSSEARLPAPALPLLETEAPSRSEARSLAPSPPAIRRGHPLPTLWLGSTGLSPRREREILKELGFEVVFRETGRIGHQEFGANALPMSQDGGALRNEFSAIVVENDPRILAECVRVFPGKIIFRSYGTVRQFGEMLWDSGAHELARHRRNLIYAPTLAEAVTLETRSGWLQDSAASLPPLHATDDDLQHMRWAGPFTLSRPAMTLVPHHDDTDERSRRQRAFIEETFPLGEMFRHIELPCLDQTGLGGMLLDEPRLRLLSTASVLLYTEQSPSILPGYAQQAIMMGVPIICLSGSSMLTSLLGHGISEAATISQAQQKIARLIDNDTGFLEGMLTSQGRLAERIRTSQDPTIFGKSFYELLTRPLDEPALPIKLTQDTVSIEWQQLEHLVTCLRPMPWSVEDTPNTRTIIECIFQVILQRSPSIEEICEYWDRAADSGGGMIILNDLLRTAEARALWPTNRMRTWLEAN